MLITGFSVSVSSFLSQERNKFSLKSLALITHYHLQKRWLLSGSLVFLVLWSTLLANFAVEGILHNSDKFLNPFEQFYVNYEDVVFFIKH